MKHLIDIAGTQALQRARDFRFMKSVLKRNALRTGMQSNKLFKSGGRKDQLGS